MPPRFLLVFLLAGVFLAEAGIPVVLKAKYNSSFTCVTQATVAQICGADCTVADILKATGMEFIDFVNLQNGHFSSLYPTKILMGVLFDYLPNQIIINVICVVTEVLNFYLLYTIIRHSPAQMGRYKRMMGKMAITDILFSSALYWLHMPSILLPLPAVKTFGLMKYFGQIGSRIAATLTVSTAGATLLSVNDCCIYRYFVFYKLETWLESFVGIPGFLLCVFAHIAIITIIGVYFIFFSPNYTELSRYAENHDLMALMKTFPKDMPFVGLNFDSPSSQIFVVVVVLFLIATGGANVGLSYAVQRKVNEVKSSLSKTTFRMQKSLTKILIAQTAIPFFSITGPLTVYPIAICLDKFEYVDSPVMEWIVIVAIGGYPLFNTLFCFYFMKPYRDYVVKSVRRLLFWKPQTVQVTVIEPSSHVESSMA